MDETSEPLPPSPLTSWDIDLLHLLAAGASAAAASEQLHVPIRTVAQRLATIRSAYDVTSTADAIDRALQHRHLPRH